MNALAPDTTRGYWSALRASLAFCCIGSALSCQPGESPATKPGDSSASAEKVALVFSPGPEAQAALQEALIEASPGTVIQLEEGRFEMTLGLSLNADGVTLRGRGMEKTILDFGKQEAGSEGLHVKGKHVVLEDFAVLDTKGNGIKSHGADDIVYRRVRAEWSGGPKASNGAYGLYPVSSKNVLIEDCVARCASDAGIYVGQSENIIVRGCRAELNVAGIEIENCHGAEVRGNTATRNTGGILVFDLPDLPVQGGRDVLLVGNQVYENNTANFAPQGNIVGNVAAGTGILVMANSSVEIAQNEIRDHDTTNILLISYFATGIEIKDPAYYPYCERVFIHDNRFGPCGTRPDARNAKVTTEILGTPIPDLVWDGVTHPDKTGADGRLVPERGIYISRNTKLGGGTLSFANLGGIDSLRDPKSAQPSRDLSQHAGELPSLSPIVIEAQR